MYTSLVWKWNQDKPLKTAERCANLFQWWHSLWQHSFIQRTSSVSWRLQDFTVHSNASRSNGKTNPQQQYFRNKGLDRSIKIHGIFSGHRVRKGTSSTRNLQVSLQARAKTCRPYYRGSNAGLKGTWYTSEFGVHSICAQSQRITLHFLTERVMESLVLSLSSSRSKIKTGSMT